MITLLPVLVLIGVFGALPVFAIPSPDFLGPLVSWVVAMLGILSVFFGALIAGLQRMIRGFAHQDKRIVHGVVIGGFVGMLLLIGFIGILRYREHVQLQEELRLAFEEDRAEFDEILEQGTSTAPIIVPAPVAVGPSTDLISSRVPTSTQLVSTEILKDVVAEKDWSDRITVLDIREPEEREIGYVPVTSTRIRYGDLINASSVVLPQNRDLLVTCWTSKRGEEIVTWLRTHGYPRAFAILGGLQGDPVNKHVGWIDAGLPWIGDAKWSAKFVNFTYLSVADAKKRFERYPVVVDTRSAEKFNAERLPGSISLPIKYMSSEQVSSTIATLSTSTTELIVVCSEYVDCFYARILGVRLSRMGWTFDYPLRDLATWKKKGYPLVHGSPPR